MGSKRVLVTYPSNLFAYTLSSEDPAQSWIQVGRTGKFTSTKYGKFEISEKDLADMVKNFNAITPDGRLPVDYDHLSNAPEHPADGKAAGWVEQLELRDKGTTLWALVSWTAPAAQLIKNNEYKYTSPSFSTRYVDTHTGQNVGTMLHAVAITNRPFLQQLQGITLCDDSVTGFLAVSDSVLPPSYLENTMNRPLSLSEGPQVGQRVRFIEDEEATPELSPEERAMIFVIKAAKGAGDDMFCKLEAVDDPSFVRWYPSRVLAPAPAPSEVESPLPEETTKVPATTALAVPPHTSPGWGARPPVVPRNFNDGVPQPVSADEAEAQLIACANQIAKDQSISLAQATKQAAMLHRDWVEMRNDLAPEPQSEPISLSDTMASATSFVDLVHSVQASHKLTDWRDAISLASAARPDLAEKYRTDGL